MGENTAISWTDSTFNPWVGCTKVSRACDFCYAESWAKRSGHPELWTGERRRTSASNWKQPLKWDRAAAASGKRARVFCASLADVFDNQVPEQWRHDLWELIGSCRNLDWLLLTKRPQNIAKMLPVMDSTKPDYRPWNQKWPWPNVWLGTTVENQEEAERRIPHLVKVPAVIKFLSCEPLLGSVDLSKWLGEISWIICGGESGGHARPMDLRWVVALKNQCISANIPFHFKQWGGMRPTSNGCLLDGQEWKQMPVAA
jgi:protein gp37